MPRHRDAPGRSKTTSSRLPRPGEIELCRPDAAFAEWRRGPSGAAQLPPLGAAGAVGKGRDQEGYPGLSFQAPSPSQRGRWEPISRGAGRAGGDPAPTSCPAQLRAPVQEKPLLLEPGFHRPAEARRALQLSTPAAAGKWVAGLGEQRVPSAE